MLRKERKKENTIDYQNLRVKSGYFLSSPNSKISWVLLSPGNKENYLIKHCFIFSEIVNMNKEKKMKQRTRHFGNEVIWRLLLLVLIQAVKLGEMNFVYVTKSDSCVRTKISVVRLPRRCDWSGHELSHSSHVTPSPFHLILANLWHHSSNPLRHII